MLNTSTTYWNGSCINLHFNFKFTTDFTTKFLTKNLMFPRGTKVRKIIELFYRVKLLVTNRETVRSLKNPP